MKALKTNSKQVKDAVKQYILQTVYDDSENIFLDFKDAAKWLNDDFKRVANHKYNLQRFPNDVNRFSDYLQGGPFWFPVYTFEIVNFLNSLGINPENKDFDSDKSTYLFALLIYREINKY
jgi:hypothetical protein